MADYDLATITGALSQTLPDSVSRTVNSAAPTLRLFPVRPGAGKNCSWAVELDGAVAENHSDGADVSTYGSDVPAFASLSWGLYRSPFKVTDLAASAAGTSHSPRDLAELVGRGIENSARKLAMTINAAAYAGAGTGTTIAGLGVGVDDDNTYAGINRATAGNALFRAKMIDPGSSTAITITLVRSDLGAIGDLCGMKPDIALCDTTRWNALAACFTDVRRFQQDVFTSGGRQITLDASVDALVVDGCLFVKDKDCTANRIYYLNSNYVHWKSLAPSTTGPLGTNLSVMNLRDTQGDVGMQMGVRPLARTGNAEKIMCNVQMQLVVENPITCGVRYNVA